MTFQALTIAGSDSGGGAGLQADLKTFSALGVYGASVINAITAQNARAVTAVQMLPPALICAQMAAVLDDLAIGAVKVGRLGGADAIAAVAGGLADRTVPVVLDPVMIAKSGDALLATDAVDALRAVLMMAGHANGATCVDLLITHDTFIRLSAPRHATRNTHGTGCTLSAAIAAGLARKLPLIDAVRMAHGYLQGAIMAADLLDVGSGHGPVHHFHALWPTPGSAQ